MVFSSCLQKFGSGRHYFGWIDKDGSVKMRALHRTMLLARRFDERLLNLQRQGRIGTFPPVKGQEAAHLGAVAQPAARRTGWCPLFGSWPPMLWRGAASNR
jgi:TPP-dependent pyruvate/acetoin dehydrogenase alpha subunit